MIIMIGEQSISICFQSTKPNRTTEMIVKWSLRFINDFILNNKLYNRQLLQYLHCNTDQTQWRDTVNIDKWNMKCGGDE